MRLELLFAHTICRFVKRGISAVPTKFGISFTTKFLNQVRWQSSITAVRTAGKVMGKTRRRKSKQNNLMPFLLIQMNLALTSILPCMSRHNHTCLALPPEHERASPVQLHHEPTTNLPQPMGHVTTNVASSI